VVVDGENEGKRGVRILVLVGGGGVFTPEYSYGTISQVICEDREKKTRSQSRYPPDHLIDLSAVGFSRPSRIQDTGYTYNAACGVCCIHGSILPCIITT